jgi:Glyoxalase-like domain
MWWGTAIEAPDPGRWPPSTRGCSTGRWPHQEPGTAIVKPPQDSVYMVFQLAEDYVPPMWPPVPDEQRTMMHLDIEVEDLEVAVALGARVADFQPHDNVRVLLDPAGHPFCLCQHDEG